MTRRDRVEDQRMLGDMGVQVEQKPRTPRQFHIEPMNGKQERLLQAIRNYPITVTIGSAGTGKTYCSTSQIANLFLSGKYEKIVLSRSNVGTGKSIGAFPGTVQDKMAPWLLPITSVLEKNFGMGFYKYLTSKNVIEVQPLETIRGRSYENSLVIVDECQNLTLEELKAITTRLGENSKMVLCGDPAQSDTSNGSGVLRLVELCHRNNIDIPIIRFTSDDVVRSDIVGRLVKMFEKENV
jgi:phosphate starvation-inducible PhoH-like protein